MKRFLLLIFVVLGLPLCILFVVFVLADPFRTLFPFDIYNTNATNREYQSTELLLHNKRLGIEYDSFIFCSSKGSNISVEQWASHLEGTPHPFLFQSWSETLTGIELKVKYLDDNGYNIKNALVMLDYPYAFRREQLPKETLALKHYLFTNQSYYSYNARHFVNFLQTPLKWYSTIKSAYEIQHLDADSINNGMCPYFTEIPEPDNLCKLSTREREKILTQISRLTESDIVVNEVCISPHMRLQLEYIKNLFDKHHTDYKIVVCPEFCLLHSIINNDDLTIIQDVFGKENVYCFSGINEYTTDIYMYSDQNHFGKVIGYEIINEIFDSYR